MFAKCNHCYFEVTADEYGIEPAIHHLSTQHGIEVDLEGMYEHFHINSTQRVYEEGYQDGYLECLRRYSDALCGLVYDDDLHLLEE